MVEAFYPKEASPFAAELPERKQRFEEAREAFLLDYGYNTARAYWGDLDDLYNWCQHRHFDIFSLTERQFRQYQALLRRRKYSESTIRRRRTAWHGFIEEVHRPSREADNTPEGA